MTCSPECKPCGDSVHHTFGYGCDHDDMWPWEPPSSERLEQEALVRARRVSCADSCGPDRCYNPCAMCGAHSPHRVGEERYGVQTTHNLTNYLCCEHFRALMGCCEHPAPAVPPTDEERP